MIEASTWFAFAGVALAMVVTPGPNMMYLASRALCQGPRAGVISLVGVLCGFAVYALLAAFGLTAFLLAVPYAYDALRIAGAIYLLWLAWNAIRPGGSSPFETRQLPADPPAKLFAMGFATNMLNPKIAMLYLALFPQFVNPESGNVLVQSMLLAATQIAISAAVNGIIIIFAGRLALLLARKPTWAVMQRWFMATLLGTLAARMLLDSRR